MPLAGAGAFDVRVQIAGQDPSSAVVATVSPAGRGVGEIVPVVVNLQLSTTVAHFSGTVRTPQGVPVVGAQIAVQAEESPVPTILNTPTAVSGPDGRYDLYIGLRAGLTAASVRYKLTYLDLEAEGGLGASALQVGQLNDLARDLTVDGRFLDFAGRVQNGYASGVPLAGDVDIYAPELGLLCSAEIALDNSYQCRGRVSMASAQPLALEYRIRGAWGTTTLTGTASALPPLGETRALPRDLVIYPTTLELRGRVSLPSGAPLAGAGVRISSPAGFVEARTGLDGSYVATMTLDLLSTSGLLGYSVDYRVAAISASQAYSVAPGALSVISKDFSYGYRVAYFHGRVANPYGIEMPFSTVTIAAPELAEGGCTTQTSPDGSYFCAAQTSSGSPFTATYTISGTWGVNSFAERIPVSSAADQVDHGVDLLANPTALHLTGTVASPDGVGLPNVELRVMGDAVYREASARTAADGSYDFHVVLKTPGAPFTGTLIYRVGYGTAALGRNVPFAARPNELGELGQDFELATRVMQFEGLVRNALAPNQLVYGSRVVVSSPQLGKLCEYAALTASGGASYVCQAHILTDQPFEVRYSLGGAWGTATVTDTVDVLPAVGQRGVFSRSLHVSPATLQLSGQVSDRDGRPLPGARVEVSGLGLVRPVQLSVNADGMFSGYAIARSGVTTPTLEYTVALDGDEPLRRRVEVGVAPGQLSALRQDFQFQSRALTLSGEVRNLTDPTLPLAGRLLIVAPTLNQVLCDSTFTQGRYSCRALSKSDDALPLNYRVEGTWGSLSLVNQPLPAGALSHVQDFAASPRVLHLNGTVRGAGGAPLEGAFVAVSSPDLRSSTVSWTSNRTDAEGRYAGSILLDDGLLTGELHYTASKDNNSVAARRAFVLGNTRLMSITQDLEISSRQIEFRGALLNSLVAGSGGIGQTRLVVSAPAFGKLCEIIVGSAGGYRGCTGTLTTDQPFAITYRLTGLWGSVTIEDTVTSIPPAGGRGLWSRDLTITPTMLRITGRALDQNGSPLAGVQVQALSPIVAASWQPALSRADGSFDALVVLKQVTGSLSASLQLQATYRSTSLLRELSFAVSEGTLGTVSADSLSLVFLERALTLTGNLRNAFAPDIAAAQPSGEIVIRTPAGKELCRLRGSSYTCPLKLYSGDPLEAIIAVDAETARAEKRVLIANIPAPGGELTVVNDVELEVTTLHVTGKVADPEGRPLVDATVEVVIPRGWGSEVHRTKTRAGGFYDLYWLPEDETTLVALHQVFHDGIPSGLRALTAALAHSEMNLLQRDVTFTRRRLRFSGQVTNELVPGLGVPGTVSVASATGSQLCSTTTTADGSYSCDGYVNDASPLSVSYTVSGGWGKVTASQLVEGLPQAGGSLLVERQIQARPTTLHLTGQVTDPFGKQLGNTALSISSGGSGQVVRTTADSAGGYSAYIVLDKNINSGNLSYDLLYYKARLREQRGFTGVAVNGLTELRQDFEISSRQLRFFGVIRHALAPELGVVSRVEISSPDGPLCASGGAADYFCTVEAVTTFPFSVTYRISGDWGSSIYTDTVPFGVVGSSSDYHRPLQVAPALLRLTGGVRTPQGAPLSGVELTVYGNALSAANGTPRIITQPDGRYAQYVVLREGQLVGALRYQISYNNTRGAVSSAFSAQLGQIVEHVTEIVFDSREVSFRGKLLNSFAPGVGVAQSTVRVSSPSFGDLCVATSGADGSYACSVNMLNSESFPVEYAVTGDWGSASLSGSAAAGSSGGSSTVVRDLAVAPTTIRLFGQVTSAAGQPLAGASVSFSGSGALPAVGSVTTDATGAYTFYLTLSSGVAYVTLDYSVRYGAATVSGSLGQRYERGALNSVRRDFTFGVRRFTFSGVVSNAYAPAMSFRASGASTVTISSPALGPLCQASVVYNGQYSCVLDLNVTEPFTLDYRVSGDWGGDDFTGAVSALPPLGGATTVARNLAITPTTLRLRLRGRVLGETGAALQGAQVRVVDGPALAALSPLGTATSAADGSYELLVALKSGVTQGSMGYHMTYNLVTHDESQPFSATARLLSDQAASFTLRERRLTFRGAVGNSFAPQSPVAATVTISAPGRGTLCSASFTSFEYSCSVVVTSTAALSLTYVASGFWGSQTFTGDRQTTFPPVGAGLDVVKQLSVTPTTLRLIGTLTNNTGGPLSGARVEVSTTLGNPSTTFYAATTNAQGAYELVIPLREGVTSGSLSYAAIHNGVRVTETQSFSATAGQLTTITKNMSIRNRSIVFQGSINNALVSGELVEARVVVRGPGSAVLCSTSFNSTSYSCTGTITTTETLSVTYGLTGGWGTATIPALAPAGSGGTSTTFVNNLSVTPTTMQLTGVVRDPAGVPLADVQVQIGSSSFAKNSQSLTVYTDGAGRYRAHVPINAGVTSGSLTYNVSYWSARLTQTGSFNAVVGQLATAERDITFNTRQIYFSGEITNALLAFRSTVAATRVSIAAPSAGVLCEDTSLVSIYECRTYTSTLESFSATVTVTGTWGTEHFSVNVPAGAIGAETAARRDVQVSPTTLRLTGTMRNSSGAPVSPASAAISRPSRDPVYANSAADGIYETYMVLEAGATSGTLNYSGTFGAAKLTSSRGFTATLNQLTTVAHDLTFTTRHLYFEGSITNALVPLASYVTPDDVTVRGPGGATICSTSSSSTYYRCNAPSTATEAFSVTIVIDGDWGTEAFSGTVAAGAVGSFITVRRDVAVSPATLRLTGTVRNSAGVPVSGATVAVASPLLAGSAQGTTSSNGVYTIYVPVDAGVTGGTLSYTFSSGSVTVTRSGPFTATPGQLVDVPYDAILNPTRVTFTGTIVNGLMPSLPIGAGSVEVRGPSGYLCSQSSGALLTSYSCSATIGSVEPFTPTFRVDGSWDYMGSDLIVGQPITSFPLGGGAKTVTTTLAISPTILHLVGRVLDDRGQPLAGVQLTISADRFRRYDGSADNVVRLTTDASGAYAYHIILGYESNERLTYVATFGTASVTVNKDIDVPRRQLSTVTQDLTLAQRRMTFSGGISNAHVAGAPLTATRVDVITAGNVTLCSYSNSTGSGSYSCSATINSTDELSLTYKVQGNWGSDTLVGVRATTPPVGGSATFARDLAVRTNTLHLSGFVRAADGAPQASAAVTVTVASGQVLGPTSYSARTSASGAYDINILLRSTTTSGSLSYTMTSGSVRQTATSSFSSRAGQLTEVARSFTLPGGRIIFTGSLVNTLAPEARLSGTQVEVLSGAGGRLCTATVSSSAYQCTAEIARSGPLSVTYSIADDWGSAIYTGTLATTPGAGAQLTVARDLPISPTTLLISGHLYAPDGTPLPGGYVSGSSDVASRSDARLAGVADASGTYTTYVVLAQTSVPSASVDLVGSHMPWRYPSAMAQVDVALAAGQLIGLSKDLYLPKQLTFQGRILNAFGAEPDERLSSYAVTISAPGYGEICTSYAWNQSDPSTYYCSGRAFPPAPATIVYDVSGPWGGEVFTRTITAFTPLDSGQTFAVDLAAHPTTVRMTGAVTLPDGTPLSGVRVWARARTDITWDLFDGRGQGYTDANGRYDISVGVTSAVVSATLSYVVTYGEAEKEELLVIGIPAHQRTLVERDITMDVRAANLVLLLENTLAPGQYVHADAMTITSPLLGTLCTGGGLGFSCTVVITETRAFSVSYELVGGWGPPLHGTGTVPAGAPGSSVSVERTFAVAPATLHIMGTVFDANGEPAVNAWVRVEDPNALGVPGTMTTPSGTYELYVPLRPGASGALTLVGDYWPLSFSSTLPFSASPGALTPATHDIHIAQRQVTFEGNLRRASNPDFYAIGFRVVVSSPELGQLCVADYVPYGSSAYTCHAVVETDEPFSVVYTVTSGAGTEVIVGPGGVTLPLALNNLVSYTLLIAD